MSKKETLYRLRGELYDAYGNTEVEVLTEELKNIEEWREDPETAWIKAREDDIGECRYIGAAWEAFSAKLHERFRVVIERKVPGGNWEYRAFVWPWVDAHPTGWEEV